MTPALPTKGVGGGGAGSLEDLRLEPIEQFLKAIFAGVVSSRW